MTLLIVRPGDERDPETTRRALDVLPNTGPDYALESCLRKALPNAAIDPTTYEQADAVPGLLERAWDAAPRAPNGPRA